MSYLGKDNATIVVAGCQDVMLKIDIEKGRIVQEVIAGSVVASLWTKHD